MNFENFENHKDVTEYLYFITKNQYSFAVGSHRIWGNPDQVFEAPPSKPFYQLMPDTLDDGFFDWYCEVRPNHQFFKSKEMCVIYFVRYWIEWSRLE